MKKEPTIDFDLQKKIHLYLDGELSHQEQEDFEAELEQNSALQKELAVHQILHWGTAQALEKETVSSAAVQKPNQTIAFPYWNKVIYPVSLAALLVLGFILIDAPTPVAQNPTLQFSQKDSTPKLQKPRLADASRRAPHSPQTNDPLRFNFNASSKQNSAASFIALASTESTFSDLTKKTDYANLSWEEKVDFILDKEALSSEKESWKDYLKNDNVPHIQLTRFLENR